MSSEYMANGEGFTGLHENAERKARRGYAVDAGFSVSINTGTLDQSDTLSVASGDAWFGGSPISKASSQDVRIDGGDSDPRKDVVYLDTNGDAQVKKGTPAPVPSDQQGQSRFATYRPTAPDLETTDATILAEVWVPADASSIDSDDFEDRRCFETRRHVLASSSETLTGGNDPALDTTLQNVTDEQLQDFTVIVTPDTDPSFNADYGISNVDWARQWDDGNSHLDLDVTVTWANDPGSSNDVSATVYAIHEDL